LLRTHVAWSAEREAGLSDARATGLCDCQRDSEISDDCATIVQQDVLRLDVPMNDVVPVRVVECAGDFSSEAHRVGYRELLLPIESLAQ
jgi:hypothetical protein